MSFLKHEYVVDATTKVVTTKESEATITDVFNPSVTLVDPVSRMIRFVAYSFLVNRLLD